MPIRIQQLNDAEATRFVDLLGGVFEHSPWVAEQAYMLGPFGSRENLHEVMINIVRKAPMPKRLELLRQHPQLAGKEATTGLLTRASKNEQAGAGLDQCDTEELAQITHFNQAYQDRFGFPFIIAVAGLDKAAILAAMQQRLENTADEEFTTAMAEVEKIAWIRLTALINE
jgi:2-oxo-4-hydroxy-4-carboxy-5-ureidoimidazoline decarboxylase